MVEVSQMGTASQTGVVAGGLVGWCFATFLGVYLGVQAATRRRLRPLRGRATSEDVRSVLPGRVRA
jgi:hypothetical protein